MTTTSLSFPLMTLPSHTPSPNHTKAATAAASDSFPTALVPAGWQLDCGDCQGLFMPGDALNSCRLTRQGETEVDGEGNNTIE